jgi:hypothetical protein
MTLILAVPTRDNLSLLPLNALAVTVGLLATS